MSSDVRRVIFVIPEEKLFYIRDENTAFAEELSIFLTCVAGCCLMNQSALGYFFLTHLESKVLIKE